MMENFPPVLFLLVFSLVICTLRYSCLLGICCEDFAYLRQTVFCWIFLTFSAVIISLTTFVIFITLVFAALLLNNCITNSWCLSVLELVPSWTLVSTCSSSYCGLSREFSFHTTSAISMTYQTNGGVFSSLWVQIFSPSVDSIMKTVAKFIKFLHRSLLWAALHGKSRMKCLSLSSQEGITRYCFTKELVNGGCRLPVTCMHIPLAPSALVCLEREGNQAWYWLLPPTLAGRRTVSEIWDQWPWQNETTVFQWLLVSPSPCTSCILSWAEFALTWACPLQEHLWLDLLHAAADLCHHAFGWHLGSHQLQGSAAHSNHGHHHYPHLDSVDEECQSFLFSW